MPLDVSGTDTEFELAPEGTHLAVCTRILDLGVGEDGFYEGKEIKGRDQVHLDFEINELMADDRPFTIGAWESATLNKGSNLRKFLEGWRGRSFTETELEKFSLPVLLGKSCLITVQHKTTGDKTRAKITAIAKMTKGMEALEPVAEPFIVENGPDDPKYDGLTDFWQQRVYDGYQRREAAQKAKTARPAQTVSRETKAKPQDNTDLDDEVPF